MLRPGPQLLAPFERGSQGNGKIVPTFATFSPGLPSTSLTNPAIHKSEPLCMTENIAFKMTLGGLSTGRTVAGALFREPNG